MHRPYITMKNASKFSEPLSYPHGDHVPSLNMHALGGVYARMSIILLNET